MVPRGPAVMLSEDWWMHESRLHLGTVVVEREGRGRERVVTVRAHDLKIVILQRCRFWCSSLCVRDSSASCGKSSPSHTIHKVLKWARPNEPTSWGGHWEGGLQLSTDTDGAWCARCHPPHPCHQPLVHPAYLCRAKSPPPRFTRLSLSTFGLQPLGFHLQSLSLRAATVKQNLFCCALCLCLILLMLSHLAQIQNYK